MKLEKLFLIIIKININNNNKPRRYYMTKIVDCKELLKNYGLDGCVGVEKRNPNDSIESMLRRFKSKMKSSGILDEYKSRRYFEKPSVTKRKKRIQSIREQQNKSDNDKDFLNFNGN